VLSKRADTALVENFESRIQGICCNWAASLSIEQSRISETGFSLSLCRLLVTCFGVIQPSSILGTLAKCAGEVYSTACSYHAGNDRISY